MATTSEITVSVTEFKAKCLELFKRLEQGKLQRIRITRRGTPLATVLGEPAKEKNISLEELFAPMRGLITIAPGIDLTEPLDIPEPDDPFIGKV